MKNKIIFSVFCSLSLLAVGQESSEQHLSNSSEVTTTADFTLNEKMGQMSSVANTIAAATSREQIGLLCANLQGLIADMQVDFRVAQEKAMLEINAKKETADVAEIERLNKSLDDINNAMSAIRDAEYTIEKLKNYASFEKAVAIDISGRINLSISAALGYLK